VRSLVLLLGLFACNGENENGGSPDAVCKEDFQHFEHCPAPGCEGARDGTACTQPISISRTAAASDRRRCAVDAGAD
jgi:hypothetical protein